MGDSTHCSQCRKLKPRGSRAVWLSVSFVRPSGKYAAIARCRYCGHEWRSAGKRARRWRREFNSNALR